MLKGEKVILRPLKIEDLTKLNIWMNDIELTKLSQGIRFPKTYEMNKEWFDNALKDMSNKTIYFGIDIIETNELLGMVLLRSIDYISGTAIWGIKIGDRNNHGKGYGFEALKLLFTYAFNVLNLRKISADVIEINEPMIRLCKKIGGFVEEARLKKHIFFDNEYYDVFIMSLFKENFKY